MPKLSQVNVRLAPEHHDLIRSIAARLRANPSERVNDYETGAGSI
jgi:hypothetical protein